MARLTIIGLSVLLALCLAGSAASHSAKVAGIPKPHKIWNTVKDLWKDPPPRPPDVDCSTPDDVGKTMKIWDPVLKDVITWICVDLEGGGQGWRRLPWEHGLFGWEDQPNIVTWDWHRRCASIVCKKELRFHVRHYVVYWP